VGSGDDAEDEAALVAVAAAALAVVLAVRAPKVRVCGYAVAGYFRKRGNSLEGGLAE